MTRKMSALEARRQLSFLKSFDRKFQVLDRELQRLNRARNSKKTVSGGWPTDGLERTVKSLIGAGAVYGLKEISTWAREFLDTLGGIRSRKTPPTQKEMTWLADRIHVLDDMQREAVERAEIILSGGELPETKSDQRKSAAASKDKSDAVAWEHDGKTVVSEKTDGGDAPRDSSEEVDDTWESPEDKKRESSVGVESRTVSDVKSSEPTELFVKSQPPGGPERTDVPPLVLNANPNPNNARKREINETAPLGLKALSTTNQKSALFAEDAPHVLVDGKSAVAHNAPDDTSESRGKPSKERSSDDFVGSSDTMPVDIIDILEVSADDGDDPLDMANAPVLPPVPAESGVRMRKILWPAIAGILLLLLGVSLYFNLSKSDNGTSNGEAARNDKTTVAKSDAAKNNVKMATLNADTASDADDDTDTLVDSENGGNAADKATAKKEKRRQIKSKSKARNQATPKKAAKENPTKEKSAPVTTSPPPASDDGPSGRLRVSMPAGVSGEIRIFVDGQKRGKAPKILSLPPGLHELRFELDGKKQLKVVSIHEGATKDVTPGF